MNYEGLPELLVQWKICKSLSEAKRLIDQKAIHLYPPAKAGELIKNGDVFRVGKRRWYEVRIEDHSSMAGH